MRIRSRLLVVGLTSVLAACGTSQDIVGTLAVAGVYRLDPGASTPGHVPSRGSLTLGQDGTALRRLVYEPVQDTVPPLIDEQRGTWAVRGDSVILAFRQQGDFIWRIAAYRDARRLTLRVPSVNSDAVVVEVYRRE